MDIGVAVFIILICALLVNQAAKGTYIIIQQTRTGEFEPLLYVLFIVFCIVAVTLLGASL